jgi:UDP-N-acetylglucosamine 2-epimerase (non-hydrolysing)
VTAYLVCWSSICGSAIADSYSRTDGINPGIKVIVQKGRPIVLVAGTRPEVIKLAAVFRAFEQVGAPVELWLTEQHRHLADEQVRFFDLPVSRRLDCQRQDQGPSALLARLLQNLDAAMVETRPAAVVVQGDTTSALAGALAAFHLRVPVAHIEAGLRSGTLEEPFPEEMNRRAIDSMATWHFPPTPAAARALEAEGHDDVPLPTGNTGIDALHWAVQRTRSLDYWPSVLTKPDPNVRLVLSTGHRRESLGSAQRQVLHALGSFVEARSDLQLVHITHPNPQATADATASLGGRRGVTVIDPVDYPSLVALLDRASLIVTDSGGLQEEAPSFGIPILVTRNVTERAEVLECGGVLVGTNPALLTERLRSAFAEQQRPIKRHQLLATPFGDGHASERIAAHVIRAISSADAS